MTSIKCKFDISCNLEDFKKKTNFYDYFLNETFKDSFDLKIITFWSFIGVICLDTCGFKKTTSIFLILNIIMFSIIYSFNFQSYDENYKYSYIRIVIIFLLWLAIGFTLGSVTQLSQQILIKYYSLFSDLCNLKDEKGKGKEKKDEEKEEMVLYKLINKENENKEEEEKKEERKEEEEVEEEEDELDNFEKNKIEKIKKENIRNDITKEEKIRNIKKIFNSKPPIFIYINKNKNKNKKNSYNSFWFISITIMLGYLTKYGILIPLSENKRKNDEKYLPKNETDINIDNETNFIKINFYNQKIFLIICCIYILCTIISIFLYWLFQKCIIINKKKEKEKEENSCSDKLCIWKFFFEIINCLCYAESIKVKNTKSKIYCCKLCCETITNYYESICCNNNLFNCHDNQEKKCCCCKYNEDDFNKDYQCFCYCYQRKGFCNWINKFITNDAQKQIFPIMIIYLISKIIIIHSENLFNEILENSNDLTIKIYCLKALIFSCCLFILIISYFREVEKNKDNQKKRINLSKINRFINFIQNNGFSEYLLLLFFVSILSFNYLIYDLLGKFKNEEEKETFLFNAIITNKLFYFSLNFYCIDIYKKNKGKELLFSQSTLITIYLYIIDLIIWAIKLLNNNVLYFIQFGVTFIFSIFYFGFFLIIIMKIIFNIFKSFCIYIKGNFYWSCCCCYEYSGCRCCYSECCDSYCSYCKCCEICYCECCDKCFSH